MKIISFYNRKGGAGKTSLSFLFAHYLSAINKDVLFVDLDPQITATNHFARLNRISRNQFAEKNAFNVLMDKMTAADVIIQAGQISLLPGSMDLSEIQSNVSPFAIKEMLKPLQYDYCIIDHAPNWSALIQSALFASDLIIIPSQPAVEEFEQAEWTYKRASKVSEADKKIILNRSGSGKPGRIEKQLLIDYNPRLNGAILKTSIPESNLVRRYTSTGEKITTAKSKQKFLSAFSQFVGEAIGENYQLELF